MITITIVCERSCVWFFFFFLLLSLHVQVSPGFPTGTQQRLSTPFPLLSMSDDFLWLLASSVQIKEMGGDAQGLSCTYATVGTDS